ncbi:MAG: hypothetical protein KZQ93_10385 [Candidatus Thiodiazotropha sp. (ex Monitilora ramsayi)]|nr:hypothetical protein [Candidatus Thiodiazotropha sp. (ex Monitilora ramsayi)]
MKNYWLLVLLSVLLTGCNLNDEVQAAKANSSSKKVWVFAQFNVPLKDNGIESYYYYGKISFPLYTRITNNQIQSGFILMDDAMYWGNDNLIYEFRDGESEGEILFRIEDIRRIELVNKRPKPGLGRDQFKLEKKNTLAPGNTPDKKADEATSSQYRNDSITSYPNSGFQPQE